MQFKTSVFTLLAVMMCVSVIGCSKKESAEKNTQVVAKVNGDEITVSQLNFYLQRMNNKLSETQVKQATKQVVKQLVTEQLLLKKAQDDKLDRDPRVLEMVEKAKTEILIKAYLEQKTAGAKRPSQQEIDDFYDKNPGLFEKRKLYRLQEIVILAGKDKLPEIQAGISDKKSMTEVAEWLKANNYQFNGNTFDRSAEQLPLELLPKLLEMKDGQAVVVPKDKSINILTLLASKEQSLDKDKAKPVIEQYFLNKSRKELEKQTIDGLFTTAKVEYLGKIKEIMESKNDDPAPAKPVEEKPDDANKAKNESLNKGLNGL